MFVSREMGQLAAPSSIFCGGGCDAVPQTACAGRLEVQSRTAPPAQLKGRHIRCDSGVSGCCATRKGQRLRSLPNQPRGAKLKT